MKKYKKQCGVILSKGFTRTNFLRNNISGNIPEQAQIAPQENKHGYGKNLRGFTLIEMLIVIGIIAVLAGIVLVAINPARQFAQARNTQRISNVTALLNAVSQNIADNRGLFVCAGGAIPATATVIKSSGGYNALPCLVPTYFSTMPLDPSAAGAHVSTETDYDTGYTISVNTTGRVTISAPASELGETISLSR